MDFDVVVETSLGDVSTTTFLSDHHNYLFLEKKKTRKEWFLVVNPAAGGGLVDKRWNNIQVKLKEAGIDFLFEKTNNKGHATVITRKAIENGFRKIIAVGGDGTGNEVANGILSQTIIPSCNIIFTLLPIGTGNDWIKTHRIPKQLDQWIVYLKNGKEFLHDAGQVNCFANGKKTTRYFINVAGLAYDAFVTKQSENKPKYFFPKIQYLLLTLRCLFKYELKKARLSFDDQVVEDYFYTINVGICRYSGGGMQLVPHANPNVGQLALTYVGKLSKLRVILNSYRFYTGKLLEHPEIHGTITRKISVRSVETSQCDVSTTTTTNTNPATITGVEVDGEFVGVTPIEIMVLPKALKIIVPSL